MYTSWKLEHYFFQKIILSIVYGGDIDLKSETDITKDEVKWGKN